MPDAVSSYGFLRRLRPGGRTVFWGSLGLILVTLALSYRGLGDWCSFSLDGFAYLKIARTLAENGHLPQERLMAPPGYPIIIAPMLLFGDFPLLSLRVLFMICWMMTGVMTYLLHRRELGEGLGWVAGLLVATNPVLLMLTTTPLSESVFIAVLSTNLVLMLAWWRRPVKHWWEVALGGLLTTAVFMIRSMGIVALPLAVYCLLRHRSQAFRQRVQWAAVFALCTVGPTLAWNLRQSAYPAGLSYVNSLKTPRRIENTNATGWALQYERFFNFGPLRLQSIKEAMLQKDLAWRLFRSPLDAPTTWFIGGFFVMVALGRFLRYRAPTDAYVLLTLLMVSLWPWDEGVRLVAPLLPVLIGYPLWLGKQLWVREGANTRQRFALGTIFAIMMILHAAGMARIQSRLPVYRDKAIKFMADVHTLAGWHESNASEDATWIGVSPKGHNGKVLLMGSAYISRRPLTHVDLMTKDDYELAFSGQEYAFVHESVYQKLGNQWDFLPNDTVNQFIVLRNSYMTGLAPEE